MAQDEPMMMAKSLAAGAGWAVLSAWRFVGSLPGWLGALPQFKIFDPVVGPVPISVVHVFVVKEWPSELSCHHEPVLKHRVAGPGTGEVVLIRIKKNCHITLLTNPSANLGERVLATTPGPCIKRIVAGITKRVDDLALIGSKALCNSVARLTRLVPCNGDFNIKWQRFFPATRFTNGHAMFQKDPSDRLVVVSVWRPKGCYSFPGFVP